MSALSPAREIAPFNVVRDFEAALCEYTGAPYAVTVTSCTMALTLAVAWHICARYVWLNPDQLLRFPGADVAVQRTVAVEIPKRTYVGVPYAIREAGGRPTFRDEDWHRLLSAEAAAGLGLGARFSAGPVTRDVRHVRPVVRARRHALRVLPLDEDARHPAGRGDPARQPGSRRLAAARALRRPHRKACRRPWTRFHFVAPGTAT
jgi:hypothetical protein